MRDSVLEKWLTDRGWKFTYTPEVPLAEVLVTDAARQNIRLGLPLNDDHVIGMAEAMENGSELPAIVTHKVSTGYEVDNGLHRVEAFRLLGRKLLDAYIVEFPTENAQAAIQILRRTVNTLNGEPLSLEERLEQAMYFIRSGYSTADAARLLGLKSSRLQPRVVAEMTQLRLKGLGKGALAEGASIPLLSTLHAVPRDKHLVLLLEFTKRARLTSDQVKELVKELRSAKSDEEMDAVLVNAEAQYSTQIAQTQGGLTRGPRPSPLRSLPALLLRANRIIKMEDGFSRLTRQDVTNILAQCRRTIADLQRLVASLERHRKKIA